MHLFALLKGLEFDQKRNASQTNLQRVSQIKIILIYSELNWNMYCIEWGFQGFLLLLLKIILMNLKCGFENLFLWVNQLLLLK